MLGRLLPVLALLATALTGCVLPDEPTPPAEVPDVLALIGTPLVLEHDHADPTLHEGSYDMTLVGHTYGYEDGIVPPGVDYGEVTWKDGWVYLCRMSTNPAPGGANPDGGFVVIDARDPANPKPVGAMPGLGCFDIKTDKTGDLVFWAQQRHGLTQTPSIAGGFDHAPRGVNIVDVSTRESPRTVGWFPMPPNGVHTLRYYCMEETPKDDSSPCGGRELLFIQTYDLHSSPLGWRELAPLGGVLTQLAKDNPATQKVVVADIIRENDGVRLEPVSVIQELVDPQMGNGVRPHDSFPEKHPVTGDHLLYVAYWNLGVMTYDINDPANPKLVSRFSDFAPSAYANMHFARTSPTLIDGKVILVAEPEIDVAPEVGQYTIVDVTDPANPTKLGWWTLPGELLIETNFRFSPHNFNIANERVYLAYNHGGVWVVDISDPTSPSSAGFYLPHKPREGYTGDIPRVWSAFYHDGLVYASDHATGLHIVHYVKDPWPVGAYLADSWAPPAE